jgi:hypothetical protein
LASIVRVEMKLDIQVAIADLIASAQKRTPLLDTGRYDELHEKAVRDLATRIGYYAESGPLFDPEGRYFCGTCCLREEPKSCSHVSGKIDMDVGSCMLWVIGDEVGLKVGQKLTQIEANYCERPKAKGFGCSRCGWYAKAKKADADGRPAWCGWWGIHVTPFACCIAESGPDLKVAPGE